MVTKITWNDYGCIVYTATHRLLVPRRRVDTNDVAGMSRREILAFLALTGAVGLRWQKLPPQPSLR